MECANFVHHNMYYRGLCYFFPETSSKPAERILQDALMCYNQAKKGEIDEKILRGPKEGTKATKAFFDETIGTFGNIENLVVFFDTENFLFANYKPEDMNITMILENEIVDQMHLSGVNCGYGGEGPHGTAYILKKLNPYLENDHLIYTSSGLYAKRGKKGELKLYEYNKISLFESREFCLSDNTISLAVGR
ncbi:hypothetical protein [Eubacterium aggregans]|uniref:hypothetical protein n=1 Tax=Eubacterium aggregans TaxID=81409 RepID=UPI003F36EE1C